MTPPSSDGPGPSGSSPVRSRVLVVGASGFLGRAVVRALAEAGHEVRGLVRDLAKGERVRESGGIPYLGDVLDVPSLQVAARGCRAIIHLAAHPSAEQEETRVRVEGTDHLLDVARSEGVPRVLVGSGYWVYAGRSDWITEESPVDPRGESQVNFEAERAGLRGNDPGKLDVVIVRPGMVYGDGSWFRSLALAIRAGEYSVVGDGKNRWSFVALPDTARAMVAVLDAGHAGEVYNVVDGNPAPLREFVDFVAAHLGAVPPPSVAPDQAAAEMGDVVARHLAADRPTSNQKLLALGWRPHVPTYREGVPDLLREMFPRAAGRRT